MALHPEFPKSPYEPLLRWWFENEHLVENADGSLSPFRYFFAQREAVGTVVWLHEVRRARDKFDLLRFDASGARKTKVLSLLIA